MMKKYNILFGGARLLAYRCNLVESLIGLMFRNLKNNECMLIKFPDFKVNAIHMIFVFFKIDVFWLDEKFKIVEITRNVKPFSIYTNSKVKSKYALEIRAGIIKKNTLRQVVKFK